MALFVKTGEQTSAMMKPTGSGIIDVVNTFPWTISNNTSEIPVAAVTEYQINSGQLLAGLYYYGKQLASAAGNTNLGNAFRGGGSSENPYEFMYFATPTKFMYMFPWLGDSKFSRSTTYAEDSALGEVKSLGQDAWRYGTRERYESGKAKGSRFRNFAMGISKLSLVGNLAGKLYTGSIPGKLGLVGTQSWEGTSGQDYTIEFDLLNTYSNTNDIRKNRELAYLLAYQNSPYRRNFAIIDPVCIYQLSIPDVVHLPACYIHNLNITNLGSTRLLQLDGENRTIPEAYHFSITFRSLIEESRNIFNGVQNSGDKIQAISDDVAFDAIKEGATNFANSASQRAQQALNPDEVGPPAPIF